MSSTEIVGFTTVFLTFTDAERAALYAKDRCYPGLRFRDLWVGRSRPKMIPGGNICEVGFKFYDTGTSKGVGTIRCTKLADMFLREVGFKLRYMDRFRPHALKPENLGIVSYRITGEQDPTYRRLDVADMNARLTTDPRNEPTGRAFFRRPPGG